MKHSASIEVVVRLAGQEVLAGRFAEIGLEHVLVALMKLADLPTHELGEIIRGAEVANWLTTEMHALRHEVAARGIDSTQARRRLRAELGRGACATLPKPIHRSDAAKKAFDEAARLAAEEHAEVVTVVHLLKALLANPTPAMVKVLGDSACQVAARQRQVPLLDRYAKDLTRLAKEGKLAAVQGHQAETKVLLEFLASSSRSAAFLITDSDDVARDIVIVAAEAISSGKPAPSLKNQRILDVSDACDPCTADGLGNLAGMLDEATTSSNIVLLVPPIDPETARKPDGWLGLLRNTIEKRQVKVVCRVSSEVYALILARDSFWRRLAQPIWLRERVEDEVPPEL
jgi:ATP-dependent Clp protease ATP-binding subunit ClpA